jgi:catechol 2,3-dioxygenase-like lactoylglutathione lyase family enzyme
VGVDLAARNQETAMIEGQRVIPALRMTQYARTREFYVEKLGFTLEWEHRFAPKMPVFCSIVRDGMQIYLSEHRGDCEVGGLVHFLIEDVDAWHEEFCQRGVAASEAPNDDLGFRNMTIQDPDGNRLRFMEPRQGPRPKEYTGATQS